MSERKRCSALLCLFLFCSFSICAQAALSASESKGAGSALSLEEISAKRRTLREELMLPSLAGLQGIVYRVVGFKNYEPLEKHLAGKLAQLKIPAVPYLKAEAEKKPCDAILQISFFKTGSNTTGELKLIQWVSLLRNPKISVRAVTYDNKAFQRDARPETLIDELAGEFVLDYLKANQKGYNAEKYAAKPKAKGKN